MKGRFFYIGVAAAVAVAAVGIWRLCGSSLSPKRPGMGMTSPVSVAEAVAQDVPQYLQGIGTVRPAADVLVTSRVSGHLHKVHFKEGQRVQAGDLLAEIDPRPFQAELDKAKGNLAKDLAELANARVDRSRYDKLAKLDYVSKQTADQQDAKVRQLEGSIKADRAAVEAAQLDLTYSRITAPVSGRLGLRTVDPGTMIQANDTTGIVRITEMHPCHLVFSLPEVDVSLVAKALHDIDVAKNMEGASATLPVEAWSRDQKELIEEGELLAIDNAIDTATGTIKLKAVFRNEQNALFANEFVNARLRVRVLKNAVTVPPAAIQLGANKSFVYVVGKDGVVHMRNVTTVMETGSIAVVGSGLENGETVVVDGVDRLKEGSKVRVAAKIETVRLGGRPAPLSTESAKAVPIEQGGDKNFGAGGRPDMGNNFEAGGGPGMGEGFKAGGRQGKAGRGPEGQEEGRR